MPTVVLLHHSRHPDCTGNIGQVVECPDDLCELWINKDPRKAGCRLATAEEAKTLKAPVGKRTKKVTDVRPTKDSTASESGD